MMEGRTAFYRAQGFRAIKIGWGRWPSFRRLDEQIVGAALRGAGDGTS
jgi:hypothetical protein